MKAYSQKLKTLKTLALSVVFFLACQASFAQTSADKKPLELPANPSSVKPVEHAVTIIKNGETVISTENPNTIKYFDGTGKTVYSNPTGNGVGEKVYTTETITNNEILLDSKVIEDKKATITTDNKTQPK